MTLVAQVSPARREAFRILLAVEQGQSHSDDLLRGKAVSALSAADRNLTTALVMGVLRWQIWLDGWFRPTLKRPNAKLDAEVLTALRLGAFQLRFLDRIPAHAAIDESVELAKLAGQRFASGMVNAVLRKLAANAAPIDMPDEAAFNQASVAAHPAWMVERWAAHYGEDCARAICRHGQTQPALVVRLETAEVENELARAGVALAPAELLQCARAVVGGDLTATETFRDGRVRIQDEGSQLIAELAGVPLGRDGEETQGYDRILDACAAPGGKTLILAERHPQARVVACEWSAPRLRQLQERLAAHEARIDFRLADAAELQEDSAFDVALADVPCSGTGTLGRNPEIRHRLRVDDLARHAERQQTILRAAIRAVRPGGRVVYSTCSLEPEENEQVIDTVLKQTADARQLSLESNIDALRTNNVLTAAAAERLHRQLTSQGALHLLPDRFHTDGFFIAQIERI